jgi:hypothetical protein
MSHSISFDTLHNYERLIKVGFNEAQAKEQTAIIAELVNEKLATKRDLNILWLKMTITMGSITVVVGGLIVAIIEHLK